MRFFLHYGDMTDATNLIRIVQETQPDEIYNLAAQTHVQVTFETPGVHGQRRRPRHAAPAGGHPHPGPGEDGRFYQASTSELFGTGARGRRSARPRPSPRAAPTRAAKVYGYWITVNYREAYGLHASNGILFNHESPIRGETFVTRKITRAVARIALGCRTRCTWATWTPSATGAMPATTCGPCT